MLVRLRRSPQRQSQFPEISGKIQHKICTFMTRSAAPTFVASMTSQFLTNSLINLSSLSYNSFFNPLISPFYLLVTKLSNAHLAF
jgi:hypothetical protein